MVLMVTVGFLDVVRLREVIGSLEVRSDMIGWCFLKIVLVFVCGELIVVGREENSSKDINKEVIISLWEVLI